MFYAVDANSKLHRTLSTFSPFLTPDRDAAVIQKIRDKIYDTSGAPRQTRSLSIDQAKAAAGKIGYSYEECVDCAGTPDGKKYYYVDIYKWANWLYDKGYRG
jgi:hypothetical protein